MCDKITNGHWIAAKKLNYAERVKHSQKNKYVLCTIAQVLYLQNFTDDRVVRTVFSIDQSLMWVRMYSSLGTRSVRVSVES